MHSFVFLSRGQWSNVKLQDAISRIFTAALLLLVGCPLEVPWAVHVFRPTPHPIQRQKLLLSMLLIIMRLHSSSYFFFIVNISVNDTTFLKVDLHCATFAYNYCMQLACNIF